MTGTGSTPYAHGATWDFYFVVCHNLGLRATISGAHDCDDDHRDTDGGDDYIGDDEMRSSRENTVQLRHSR